MNTHAVIDVADLTKVYVTDEVETHALTGVNLRVDSGEYVAIMGPSGCGKTTLMSILGLLDSPTTGTYDLAGTPVATLDARQRAHFRNRNIGFVFQSFNLIGDLNVYENVELPLVYRGGSAAPNGARRWRRPWRASACCIACGTTRPSSPAANSSASPSRALWLEIRRSCSRTSPREISTPQTGRRSWSCWLT